MATIKDIAKETGLARTTVAEVLRGKAGYSDDSRRRVQDAARRLGYRPNYLSKALSGGASMTIGIVVPSHVTPVTHERVLAIEAAAREAGYLAYLSVWGDEGESDRAARLVENLLHRRVDGLVCYFEGRFPEQVDQVIDESDVPCIFFPECPEGTAAAVRSPCDTALADLARHLRDLGHRTAALLATPFHLREPQGRLDPTRRTMEEAGIELEDWRLPEGYLDSVDVRDVIRERLADGAPMPDVLLADDDEGAHGVLAALDEAGMTVPGDLSLVGFGDRSIAATMIPPLTTIREPGEEVGRGIFESLVSLMTDDQASGGVRTFDCELVVRDSTGCKS